MRYSITFKDFLKLDESIRYWWFYLNDNSHAFDKIPDPVPDVADTEDYSDFQNAEELK